MKKLVTFAIIAAAAMSAQASSTVYTSFDDWTDNLQGVATVDTLNNYGNFTTSGIESLGNSVTLGAITYSIEQGQLYGVTTALNYDAPYHTSNYLEWQSGTPNTLTLTLSGNTNAFGIKIGQFYGTASNYQIAFGNGDSFNVAGSTGYTFFGAISTTAFSTIKITGSDFPTIDNVALGTVTAVPEPESYAMLLAGLGLMGAIARRRNQKKQNS